MPKVQETNAILAHSLPGNIVLPGAPTPGNRLILALWGRAGDVSGGVPDGFDILEVEVSADPSSWLIADRLVEAGDPATWESPLSVARRAYLVEWSGILAPSATYAQGLVASTYGVTQQADPSGTAGDLIFALFGTHSDRADRLCHVDGDTILQYEEFVDALGFGPWASVGTIDQPGPATATYDMETTWYHHGAVIAVNYPVGVTAPPIEPPPGPGEPGKAILEIYVHDEAASRWGTATWADHDDPPAVGTEGAWSSAGWQDITPQGVMAHIRWGSTRADRGILADQDAASWNILLYDPDRILDPGNPDSPFAPQIVQGVPIRVSHDGREIRRATVERFIYNHKAPEYQGQIIATGPIAMANRAEVPEDSLLDDFLLGRVTDALVAAEIAVPGFPMAPLGPASAATVPLSPRIDGAKSAWHHIRSAAREALWVAYETGDGRIGLRAWGSPLERGAELTDAILEDLATEISEDGAYSGARVTNDDGTLVIERYADPLPRYGRRPFTRDETTEDPESWADAIIADRAWPGVQYHPGTIYPRTAEQVTMLGGLEIMERLQTTVAGVASVSGRILGGELWVQHRQGKDGATWRFKFVTTTDGASIIGTTTLVSSQAGDVLVDSQTETDYLEAN